jgi:hypothetical protein
MKKEILIFCAIAAWLAGCSSSGQKQSTEKYQGREETKKLEGASAVGYDGIAVRKSVDNTLDKNDVHSRDLDKALKEEK